MKSVSQALFNQGCVFLLNEDGQKSSSIDENIQQTFCLSIFSCRCCSFCISITVKMREEEEKAIEKQFLNSKNNLEFATEKTIHRYVQINVHLSTHTSFSLIYILKI